MGMKVKIYSLMPGLSLQVLSLHRDCRVLGIRGTPVNCQLICLEPEDPRSAMREDHRFVLIKPGEYVQDNAIYHGCFVAGQQLLTVFQIPR